jgi:hypothetical protein
MVLGAEDNAKQPDFQSEIQPLQTNILKVLSHFLQKKTI